MCIAQTHSASEKSLNFLFILTEMSTGGIALENSPEEKKLIRLHLQFHVKHQLNISKQQTLEEFKNVRKTSVKFN